MLLVFPVQFSAMTLWSRNWRNWNRQRLCTGAWLNILREFCKHFLISYMFIKVVMIKELALYLLFMRVFLEINGNEMMNFLHERM